MIGPCSKIPKRRTVIHLQWPVKGMPTASQFTLTLHAPLDLTDHMVQVTEQLSQPTGRTAELSLILGPIPNEQLSCHSVTKASNTPR